MTARNVEELLVLTADQVHDGLGLTLRRYVVPRRDYSQEIRIDSVQIDPLTA
jgi:hypothetical protein